MGIGDTPSFDTTSEHNLLSFQQQLSKLSSKELQKCKITEKNGRFIISKCSITDNKKSYSADTADNIQKIASLMKSAYRANSSTVNYLQVSQSLDTILTGIKKQTKNNQTLQEKIETASASIHPFQSSQGIIFATKQVIQLSAKIADYTPENSEKAALFLAELAKEIAQISDYYHSLPNSIRTGVDNPQAYRDFISHINILVQILSKCLHANTGYQEVKSKDLAELITRCETLAEQTGAVQPSFRENLKEFHEKLLEIETTKAELQQLIKSFAKNPLETSDAFARTLLKLHFLMGGELFAKFIQSAKLSELAKTIEKSLARKVQEPSFSFQGRYQLPPTETKTATEATIKTPQEKLVQKWSNYIVDYNAAVNTFERTDLQKFRINGKPFDLALRETFPAAALEITSKEYKIALMCEVMFAESLKPNQDVEKLAQAIGEAITVGCIEYNPCRLVSDSVNCLRGLLGENARYVMTDATSNADFECICSFQFSEGPKGVIACFVQSFRAYKLVDMQEGSESVKAFTSELTTPFRNEAPTWAVTIFATKEKPGTKL